MVRPLYVHTTSRGLIKNITGLWRVSKTNDAVILTTEWFKGLKETLKLIETISSDESFREYLRTYLDNYNGDIYFYVDRESFFVFLITCLILIFLKKKQRGYKNCLQKLQADSNENFQGRVKFKIPSQVEAYVNKKSDRTIDGSTYKTYLASRPQSMTEANGTRDCTSVRHVVESKFKEMKGFKLIRTTWPHCKIQDQVS